MTKRYLEKFEHFRLIFCSFLPMIFLLPLVKWQCQKSFHSNTYVRTLITTPAWKRKEMIKLAGQLFGSIFVIHFPIVHGFVELGQFPLFNFRIGIKMSFSYFSTFFNIYLAQFNSKSLKSLPFILSTQPRVIRDVHRAKSQLQFPFGFDIFISCSPICEMKWMRME